MRRATFIGHQGWLLRTERTGLRVDPLLTEGFGYGGPAGRVFPPRRFAFDRMPPIDAVYVSSRSSVAMYGVLEGLGFTVRGAGADAIVHIGDLTLGTFVADHRATPADRGL
jgi:hypothetical protein